MRMSNHKRQTDSYRVIGGVRFVCWQDLPTARTPELVAAIRKRGVGCRVFLLGEGMSRTFIPASFAPPTDFPRWDSYAGMPLVAREAEELTEITDN